MDHQLPNEDTARVLIVAVALWGAAVSLAAVEGVFANLPPATLVVLAAFAFAYAPAMVLLDRSICEFVRAVDPRALWLVVAAASGLLAALGLAGEGDTIARLERAPGAIAALFAGPIAAALVAAAMDRVRHAPRSPTSGPAKSPGATPAAT